MPLSLAQIDIVKRVGERENWREEKRKRGEGGSEGKGEGGEVGGSCWRSIEAPI